MNEELKIFISVDNDKANNDIDKTKKKLSDLKEETEKSNQFISDTMDSVKESVSAALKAITAFTAGFMLLARQANETQKSIGRLISNFQSLGSSAKQATQTYKQLYSFLGDTDTATEAANLLAQITTNTQDLTEWTTILQGVYATFPDSLPVESLAEATNETIKTGKVTGALADAVNWLGVNEDAVNAKLQSLNSTAEREAYLRGLLNDLYGTASAHYAANNSQLIAYNQAQANLQITMANLSRVLTPMLTALSNLGNTLLTYLKPAIENVSAALVVFCQWLAQAVAWVGALFGIKATFDAVETSVGNVSGGVGDMNAGLEEAVGTAKELKRQTMGFDELNVVSKPSSGGGGGASSGGGGGGAISVPTFEMGETNFFSDFEVTLGKVKETMKGILTLALLVGAGIGAWKLLDAYTNGTNLASVFQSIVGYALIIGGAVAYIYGYLDAWTNGIDWTNLLTMLGGLGAIVGGLYLTFGTFGAAIGLVFGGISMVVLGIKDFIENGYSMEGVIAIVVGVLGVLIGVIWAFNAALLANPIVLIVEAIIVLIGVFVVLWNECDGFRQFFIDMWEGIKTAFNAVVDWLAQACEDIADFFVDAWNAIKNAWSAVKNWFSNIWTGIKNVFSSVGTWFSNIFKSAWNGIKKAFSAVGSFFTGIWDTIKGIFSKVGSAIGDAVSKAFKSAVNWVLEKAIGIINGFISAINAAIGVINLIPGVNISKIKKLDVPELAQGGITKGTTLAKIGEGGYKEAVLPLERNTEWMDMLADRINGRNGTPSKIVLMLDGKELGWANINSINSITRQTGELQLQLV